MISITLKLSEFIHGTTFTVGPEGVGAPPHKRNKILILGIILY